MLFEKIWMDIIFESRENCVQIINLVFVVVIFVQMKKDFECCYECDGIFSKEVCLKDLLIKIFWEY